MTTVMIYLIGLLGLDGHPIVTPQLQQEFHVMLEMVNLAPMGPRGQQT